MSVNIATMGLFKDCCGRAVGGGGAPPYRYDEARVAPVVFVKKLEVKDFDSLEKITKQIKVKLVDETMED